MIFRNLLLVGLLTTAFTTSLAQSIQYGIWHRYDSPNGYNTDLAIGNIPGEPSNRVYMCEFPGSPSAGLYKGTISGETITWDSSHGLPNARFFLNAGVMVLYFGVGDLSQAGKYRTGAWRSTCGPLANQNKKIVIGVDPNEYGISGRSISITINNVNTPYTSLNSVLLNPTCSVTLPAISGDYYSVKISASGEGVSGPTTQVYNSVLYKSELTAECNVLKPTYTGPTIALMNITGVSMPVIGSINPSSGPIGSPVTITGTGFSPIPANNEVIFGTTAYAVVTASTATSITTTVPAGATTGKITVMISGITAQSSTDFTVVLPAITGFTPLNGITGTPVTITGAGFSTTPANNTVKFGSTPAVVTASTASTISTMVPPGSITGKISVTVGGQTLTSATDFINNTLAITGFTPTSGTVGEDVVISGANFSTTPGDNIVKFNGTSAVVTTATSASLRVKVPTAATSGPLTVIVGAQTVTTTASFQVCPTITLSVSTLNNTSFTITATGGVAPYTYSYDGTHFFSGTDLPLGPGALSVWAKDANGCKASSRIQINGLATCGVLQQAASPASTTFTTHSLGSRSGSVRIEYDMLTKADQLDVYYNNELVATTGSAVTNKGFVSFTYNYDAAKPQFCVIKIHAPDNSSEWNYTTRCQAIPTPKITAFSPVYGKAGVPVTIEGYNFSAGTVVKFGTTLAISPVINSSGTQIIVNVPAGATSAPIIVSNTFGSSLTTTDFTVSQYCLSQPSSADGTKINIVKFGNIGTSGPSAVCESYTDNSAMIGYLSAGTTYSLKVFVGTCSSAANSAVRAYIDWNGDFDFADTGEIVATSPASASTTREETFSVTVPASLTVASTRMRVVVSNTNTPSTISDCGVYSFGETEDYTLSFITAGTPVKNASPSTLTEFEALVGIPSVVRAVAVSGSSLGTTSFVVTAPTHFQVSNQATAGFASSVTIPSSSGAIGTSVYVRYLPTAAGTHSGNITVTNSIVTTPSTIAVSGKATAPVPSLQVYALFDDFYFTVATGQTIIQPFTIEGSHLTGNVTISASANFRFSLSTSGFTQTLTLTQLSGTIAQRVVYVQYQPGNLVAPTSENISISSPGLNNETIPVTGRFSPVVANLSPATGIAGTTVVITGSNFYTTPARNIVRFGGIYSVVTASTANSITTTVPAGAETGPIPVTVGPGATLGTATFTVISTVPTISLLSPTTGAVGTTVTITGTNFSGTPANNIVKFNNTAAIVTASTPTSLTTTVPAGATTGPVTVTVGSQTNTGSVIFTVQAPAPAIASFSPASGSTGTSVTITGTNFSTTAANNVVKFNGTIATITGTPTATSIVTTVPSGASSGKITVAVGGQVATSSTDFTVTIPGSPTVTGFSPASGPAGTAVTITGTNFSTTAANNVVLFDGTIAIVTGTPTATSIVATVPAGVTLGKITVMVGGLSGSSSTDFIVTAPGTHTITAFSPASGPAGTTITITGSNFSTTATNNTVKFNGTAATISGTPTATSIVTTVPTGATTGKITVEVGGLVVTSSTDFTVTPPGSPAITGFSPTSGPTGTSVVITGSNFSTTAANNTVKFNGTIATITGTPTATSIATTVPPGTTSGKITVEVGGQLATSTNDFTIAACTKPPKPTITAINLDTSSPILTSSSATGNQWFLNGSPIPNSNGESLTIVVPGVYKTQVTVAGGCVSDFSDDFALIVTGDITPQPSILHSYYPNPVSDRLIVETSQTGLKSMRIFHADGKQIHQLQFETTSVEVDVIDYPTGMYYFIVTSGNGTDTGKFVKH